MNVKVLVSGSDGTKAVPADVFTVEQANSSPLSNQKSFGAVVGRRVGAFVPACIPSSESQSPANQYTRLASCYENCIMAAAAAGGRTVVVKPLGVGQRRNEVFENGQLLSYDIWGDLYWTQAKSSMAAKLAVQAASARADCPDDLVIIFVVPKEALDDWDSAMRF